MQRRSQFGRCSELINVNNTPRTRQRDRSWWHGRPQKFSRGGGAKQHGLTKLTYFRCAEDFREFFGALDSTEGKLMRAPKPGNSLWCQLFKFQGELPQADPSGRLWLVSIGEILVTRTRQRVGGERCIQSSVLTRIMATFIVGAVECLRWSLLVCVVWWLVSCCLMPLTATSTVFILNHHNRL